jgi:hypothetical protein
MFRGSCEKAASSGLPGAARTRRKRAARTRRKRAAIVFEAARSCVASRFITRGAKKSCVSAMRGQNLTKKIKFFQEKLQLF